MHFIAYDACIRMSKASRQDPECSNCGIHKSQHFFGRMDRRCPGPDEGDRPLELPSADPLGPTPSELLDPSTSEQVDRT